MKDILAGLLSAERLRGKWSDEAADAESVEQRQPLDFHAQLAARVRVRFDDQEGLKMLVALLGQRLEEHADGPTTDDMVDPTVITLIEHIHDLLDVGLLPPGLGR